jgi:hypothetical protein
MISAITKMSNISFVDGVIHYSDTDEIKRAKEIKPLL